MVKMLRRSSSFIESLLTRVRNQMQQQGVSAFFLPHSDPHHNEYLSAHDMRMPFISGFSGSAGYMVITHEKALLWTDSRYWLQAENELYPGWELMKITQDPPYYEWVIENLPTNSVVGFDSSIVPAKSAKVRTEYFEKKGYTFKPVSNFVDQVWEERPLLSTEKVFVHELEYSGLSVEEKLGQVSEKMGECRYLLVTALDEIAWVLNLRGNDVDYNPVFFAYLVVEKTNDQVIPHLFINQEKIDSVREHLASAKIREYSQITEFLSAIEEKVSVNPNSCNLSLYNCIKNPFEQEDDITHIKACKSQREIQGFKDSHIRDGLAICRYFSWLKNELLQNNSWNEYSGAQVLKDFRLASPVCKGPSFETISSVGPNAAVIHYRPDPETSSEITTKEIYLLDSGGHYLDGTTDTTRTVHFGEPTSFEKECYTRVLLGNLDLERMVWPKGMTGADLDVVARRRLWEKCLSYGHGTGHGVGYFLNVHEGPHGISRGRTLPLKEGMVTSNEPGYYEPHNFGIRIENMMYVAPKNEKFYCFENLTMVPYDKNLIDKTLLSQADLDYINEYHRKVHATLSPLIEDQVTQNWLDEATSPLE